MNIKKKFGGSKSYSSRENPLQKINILNFEADFLRNLLIYGTEKNTQDSPSQALSMREIWVL